MPSINSVIIQLENNRSRCVGLSLILMSNRDLIYWENTACCQIWCNVPLHSFPFLTMRKAPQHSPWVHSVVLIPFPPQSPRKFLLCQHAENWLHSFFILSLKLSIKLYYAIKNTRIYSVLVISLCTPLPSSHSGHLVPYPLQFLYCWFRRNLLYVYTLLKQHHPLPVQHFCFTIANNHKLWNEKWWLESHVIMQSSNIQGP